jgi:hypothetical protein
MLLWASTTTRSVSGSLDCQMVCKGNSSERCGGHSALHMYNLAPVATTFSVMNSTVSPTSSSGSSTFVSSISSSVSIVSTSSSSVSDSTSSTTATYISTSSTLTSSSASADSSSSISSSTSPVVSITTTSISSTTSPIKTAPAIVSSVIQYNYVGCYAEPPKERALADKFYVNDTMTIEMCATTCSGYTWLGVEYSRECKMNVQIS